MVLTFRHMAVIFFCEGSRMCGLHATYGTLDIQTQEKRGTFGTSVDVLPIVQTVLFELERYGYSYSVKAG